MNQDDSNTTTTAPGAMGEEQEVRRLLSAAGRRAAMPAEDHAVVKESARVSWEEMVAAESVSSSGGRMRQTYALAASLLLAVAVGWWWMSGRQDGPPLQVATVELEVGAEAIGSVNERPGETFEVSVGDALAAGVNLATAGGNEGASGRLALRMTGGESVRLDVGTRVRLASASRLELEEGAVYVDSDPLVQRGAALEVVTPFGVVRHIGTQYEVRLDDSTAVRVRVREGSVSVRKNGDSWAASSGEELTLENDGSVTRGTVGLAGSEWLWTLAAAPSLEIEGMSLDTFLRWVTRETGWQLEYEDADLAASAEEIILYGPIDGLQPVEAVGVIVEGSGLVHHVEDGVLRLSRQ